MKSRYFRCEDPSGNCPRHLAREIISEKEWSCPCNNPECSELREEVPWLQAIAANHRRGILIAAFSSVFLLCAIVVASLAGGNISGKLHPLQKQLDILDGRLNQLQSRPKPLAFNTEQSLRIRATNDRAVAISQSVDRMIAGNDTDGIPHLQKEAESLLSSLDGQLKSLAAEPSDSGTLAVEAIQLAQDYEAAEEQVELTSGQIHEQGTKDSSEANEVLANLDDLGNRARKGAGEARRLTVSSAPRQGLPREMLALIEKSRTSLSEDVAKLAKYQPPVKTPFAAADATLRIMTTPEIATSLLRPLLAAWTETDCISGPDKVDYFDCKKLSQKIVLKSINADDAFGSLAKSETDLLFIDRDPSPSDRQILGPNFGTTRSVAEVIALDALTLLVNPDNRLDTYEVGKTTSLSFSSGPRGSASNRHALSFGFLIDKESERSATEVVMNSPDIVAFGLYHEEGSNPTRAKRLDVKPSANAPALKPSPFTIATEDYKYFIRVVAWNPSPPKPAAFEFVRFVTSDSGQDIVQKSGYVDLRLRSIEGSVDPRFMATLSEALGVSSIQSASRLSTNFRFQTGKSDIDLKAQADIERLPRYIATSYPTHKVVILGFTDRTGPDNRHLPLSKDRARIVADQLSRFKVDARIGGLGCDFPIDADDTDTGRARNRRAEVWVVKP